MSDDQLLAIASTAVLAANDFPRPTDDWEAKPRANKTWTAWKTHYHAAHIAQKHQLLASGATPVPWGIAGMTTPANPQTPTFTRLDSYLDSLTTAATPDQSTIACLIKASNRLMEANNRLTKNLTTLTAAYNKLLTAMPHAAITAAPTMAATTPAPATSHQRPTGTC